MRITGFLLTPRSVLSMLFCLALGLANTVSAYTKYTSRLTSADWSGANTWLATGSGTPITYHILSGHTVTLDVNAPSVDTLIVDGTFEFDNFKTLDVTVGGAIILGANGVIKGGNAHSSFTWSGSTVKIKGPYNGSQKIDNGPRFATRNSAIAANGDPQGSFLFGVLPVDLVSFNASAENDLINVTWTSLGVEAGDVFVIQTSADGMSYVEAGRVVATVEATREDYNFSIHDIKNSVYVRLQVISKGTTRDLIRVYMKHSNQSQTAIASVYPSVIDGQRPVLHLQVAAAGNYHITLRDAQGKQLAGLDVAALSDNQVLDVSAMAQNLTLTGIYYATINHESGGMVTAKLIAL